MRFFLRHWLIWIGVLGTLGLTLLRLELRDAPVMVRLNEAKPFTAIAGPEGYVVYAGRSFGFNPGAGPCGGGYLWTAEHAVAGLPWVGADRDSVLTNIRHRQDLYPASWRIPQRAVMGAWLVCLAVALGLRYGVFGRGKGLAGTGLVKAKA